MSEKEVCEKCKQTIPDRCALCNQLIVDRTEENEVCSHCGQELPDEFDDHEFIKQKDGSQRAVCKWCERPYESCPKCKRDFESGEEDEDEEDDSDDEDTEEEDESEDESTQKGKGKRRRIKI